MVMEQMNLQIEEFKRLQIEKLKREADEVKKAQIRGNIVKAVKSGKELRIFNSGKATARNVRVEWLVCLYAKR